MKTIELLEEDWVSLPRDTFTDDEARALYEDPRFLFEFPLPINDYAYRLRSNGWIGHIPVGENTVARVSPKVPIASVFAMIEVAYGLASFRFLPGNTGVTSIEDLYASLASILARRIRDRAKKGLYRAYVPRSDDLQFVRGRIDVRGNLRNALSGAARLRCNFYELTPDLDDNQIALWALYVASRLNLRSEAARTQVRQAYRTLSGSVSLAPKMSADCVGRLYHRLNADYEPLHAIARFLIEHAEPSLEWGEHRFLPFHINMPRLFEAFVAAWLTDHAPAGTRVERQYFASLQGSASLRFQMDLVLFDRASDQPLAVLDTKYKRTELPTEADIQQVVAYAVRLGATRAYLVYPSAVAQPVALQVGPISVRSCAFDLALDHKTGGRAFLAALT